MESEKEAFIRYLGNHHIMTKRINSQNYNTLSNIVGRTDIFMIPKKIRGARRLQVLVITGRTINQGRHKERGKLSKEYTESVSVCEMNEEDMRKLGIKDGDGVKIATEYGSIVLTARRSKKIQQPGIVFIPYGPWANYVIGSSTEGTGMPLLKGLPANVEPTVEEVLTIKEIIDLVIS